MSLNYLGNCALQENVIITIIIIIISSSSSSSSSSSCSSSSSGSSSSSSILGMKQLVGQEECVDQKLQAYSYGSELS